MKEATATIRLAPHNIDQRGSRWAKMIASQAGGDGAQRNLPGRFIVNEGAQGLSRFRHGFRRSKGVAQECTVVVRGVACRW